MVGGRDWGDWLKMVKSGEKVPISLQSRDRSGHGEFCGFSTFAAHLPCGRC